MAKSSHKARIITNEVIKTLAVAGALSAAVVAPNTAELLNEYFRRKDRRNAQKTIYYLKYRKLIQVKTSGGKQYYKLTSKGRDKYERILFDELAIRTPLKWDRKWRVVAFDIPASKNTTRAIFLNKIKSLDFFMLQHSVWVHPFECEKQVGMLLNILHLEKHVTYFVVEKGNFKDHAIYYFKKRGLLM